MEQLKRQMKENRDKLSQINTKLSLVAATSDRYLNIRNCFFAVFLRDHLDQESDDDHQAIISGNQSADFGDAFSDAILFERQIRHDWTTFKLLYGFMPQIVIRIWSKLF